MKLYYKFSVVDDYLIIEFNGKKVDVFPREDVFLDADRLLKFKKVHIRYHSDEVVKFTEEFENCSLNETSPVSVQEFLDYFTAERVGLTGAASIDYTPLLTSILEAVDDLELTTENIRIEAGQINLNTDEVEDLLKDIKELLITDELGKSCDTPIFSKDCDRTALLDKIDAAAITIKDNATLNKTDLVSKLDELKVVLTSIEANTVTSNDNEALIITELETANTTLEAILAEQNKSLVYTTSTEICVDGVTQMTRVKTIWDNEANVVVSETSEFSLDGVNWTTTAPIGTITIGSCVTEDLTGKDCTTPMFTSLCNVDEIVDPLTSKLDEVIAAINDTSTAEQAILTSIDTKLDELVLIKDQLVEANATLVLIKDEAVDINTNTAEIVTQTTLTNTKLDEIKVKLDTQITELGNIKQELIDANTSLDTVNTNLVTINDNIILIKADIATIKTDIAAIKTSVANIEANTEEIKVAVQSIDTKLTTVNDHLTTIEGKLDTINTTLQTEFDQTQVLLGEVKTAIEFAQDTFQPVDCVGTPVGSVENVLKVIQLSKQTADICNTDDITTPIIDKLDELLAAINSTEAPDYTALLTSIDTKLNELAVITGELEAANVTLDGIKVDTAGIKTDTAGILTQVSTANTNLVNIKTELETQTTKLEDIKALITDTNAELVDINAELDVISSDIALIKADISTIKADIATIKSDVSEIKTNTAAIKVAVESIDTKLSTVITSLSSIEDKLDTIHDDLLGITSILQDIKDELDVELIYTTATKVNNGTANFYSREKIEWDSETQTEISRTIEFSTDGFTWTDGEPAGTITIGWFSTDTSADLLDKLDEVIAAINDTSDAEQVLLTSIDTKLNDLALIKTELITANATLTSIEGDTSAIQTNTEDILTQVTTSNTKLEDIKTKLDTQITLLEDLKTELIDANISLDTANATLTTISGDVATIKTDISTIKVDIAAIKTSVAAIEADTEEIKVAVQSIDTKLTTVNNKLDSIETKLDTINTTLQTEFDETQAKLDEVVAALEYAQDTFQVEDCDGAPIGTPQNVLKVVQINKQESTICNTTDITSPIVDAINNQVIIGKKQDFISWTAVANDTMTIPINKFSTIAMLAAKGEFKIENTSNDFSIDITTSAGTISNFVEISEDGVGTSTGATSVSQGFDTRANAVDMDVATNSFLVTCVRNGILQIEAYKS